MKNPSLLLLFFVFLTSILNAQTLFFNHLTTGPHQVGFQTIYQHDYSRSYQPKYKYGGELENKNTNRLMQMAIWYPAQKGTSNEYLTLLEYITLAFQEDHSEALSAEQQREIVEELKNYQFSGQTVANLKTTALKKADLKVGKFPVILYAPSLSASVAENFVLCEYLASHGFVVASVPAKGTYINDMQSADLQDIETQSQDLAFLLNFMHSFPNADANKIGVCGFSIGGLSNVILALRNMHIDAVVSLDGSIVSQGYLELMQDQYYFDPSRMRAAFCQISKNKNNPAANPSNFLHQIQFADTHLIRFADLDHQDFNAFSIFFNYLFKNKEEGTKAIEAYPKQCRLTLEFFNAYLKKQEQSLAFLKASPTENGWEEDEISKQYEQGKKVPPTKVQFLDIIRQEGAEKATRVFEEVQEQTPDHTIFEKLEWRVLLGLGNEYIESDQLEEAIKILELNLKVYPHWYRTHFALARAWKKLGDKDKAIEQLQACLEFHPRFEEAQELLKVLDAETPNIKAYSVGNKKYLGVFQFPNQPRTAIQIFQKKQELFCEFKRDHSKHLLIPDSKERFLIDGVNAQFFFQFDEKGHVLSMRMLGLNSGRFGEPRFKVN
jgi:tetratricopeptide (TPR) repeat protein